jgi:hypothetical protein
VIENDTDVTLYANGVSQVTHSFAQSVTDGEVGLGTRSAISRFDDLLVAAYVQAQTQAQTLTFAVRASSQPSMMADPSAVFVRRLPEAVVDSIFDNSSTLLDPLSLVDLGVRRRVVENQRLVVLADLFKEDLGSTDQVFEEYENVLPDRWGWALEINRSPLH